MQEDTKTLLLKEAKATWETRYRRQAFSARWTSSDDRKEPIRQKVPGEKPVKEPAFLMGGKWMHVSREEGTREIVTVEKLPEKALEEWAVESEKEDYNREEFCKAFRQKYEGVRSEDIDVLVQTFQVWLIRADLMNPTLEKEKAKEQATAPMNPILLEGKEKDPAPSTSTPSSTPHAKKRKGSGEDPRPKKQTKKDRREKRARKPKQAPEPAPEPELEPELEPEQGHPEPPSDSVGANTRAITPWVETSSKRGGIIWERTIEVTHRDGTTHREPEYDHKDESTRHLPNYQRARIWRKQPKRRRRQ